MKILVINAGSSSLKYQFIDIETQAVLAKGLCERIGIEGSMLTQKVEGKDNLVRQQHMNDHSDAINMVIEALTGAEHNVISDMKEIDAVGHRVVHGGEVFSQSVIIDEKVMDAIRDCIPLAPLHNPAPKLSVIRFLRLQYSILLSISRCPQRHICTLFLMSATQNTR